jgi:putative ATP-dependent endonuclease of the OLD family
MRIRRVDIQNFRGIKCASWRLPKDRNFLALIGPGDSTKTTLLTAIERTLHDRAGMTFVDTDFYGATVDEPIRIRVAVGDLPDQLITMDTFGTFLSGIDDGGEWSHDPANESERCVIVELLVEADLEPVWQSYRPPLGGPDVQEDDPRPVRSAHRARMTASASTIVLTRTSAGRRHRRWGSSLRSVATPRRL